MKMSNILIAVGITLTLIGFVIKFQTPPGPSTDSVATHDMSTRESIPTPSPAPEKDPGKKPEPEQKQADPPSDAIVAPAVKSPEPEQKPKPQPEPQQISIPDEPEQKPEPKKELKKEPAKQSKDAEKTVAKELSSKAKGNEFEAFYADIFKYHQIRIKEWNQGTITKGGAMGENALNPDFFVIQKVGDFELEYWVECKWRKSLASYKGLPEYQYERYKKIQRESHRKIFIALGVGGTPDKPQAVYVIPLDSLPDGKISKAIISPYFHSDPKMQLSSRIKDYFYTKVFRKKH